MLGTETYELFHQRVAGEAPIRESPSTHVGGVSCKRFLELCLCSEILMVFLGK